MNKTFIRTDRTLCPSPKELRFLGLIEGYEIKKDDGKYPGYTFYFKGDKCLFELINSTLWTSYFSIWIIFEKEFNMEFDDIRSFIIIMAEKHFKLKGVTPNSGSSTSVKWVEQHFKWNYIQLLIKKYTDGKRIKTNTN